MGTFADSALGKVGAVPVPVLFLHPSMRPTEDSRCFIAASRCEHGLFIQREAGTKGECVQGMPYVQEA